MDLTVKEEKFIAKWRKVNKNLYIVYLGIFLLITIGVVCLIRGIATKNNLDILTGYYLLLLGIITISDFVQILKLYRIIEKIIEK